MSATQQNSNHTTICIPVPALPYVSRKKIGQTEISFVVVLADGSYSGAGRYFSSYGVKIK
jgi:hypothetical protein